jgi:hypothetical protein
VEVLVQLALLASVAAAQVDNTMPVVTQLAAVLQIPAVAVADRGKSILRHLVKVAQVVLV